MRFRYAVGVAMLSTFALTSVSVAQPASDHSGRFDQPQDGFADASTVLTEGAPSDVGLDPAPIDVANQRIANYLDGRNTETGKPMYAGAVSLLAHDGVIVNNKAHGHELRYSHSDGTELPRDQWERTNTDTIYDMASVTKLFTSISVLQQVEAGKVNLDAPVAEYIPEFAVHGKENITVKQLLTHTSGLQATIELWKRWPDKPSRINGVLSVKPEKPPGTQYVYSDLNMITLGVLVERVTGTSLDKAIARGITQPLNMTDTGFNPPPEKRHRIAATEHQTDPARGMLRGQVHDENAWSLGGVAGQAGIFSTANDIAVLGQTILNGGTYRGQRILNEESARKMLANYNDQFPEHSHGLGFELNQRWYMDGLSSPSTAGHTGYTGTSLVIDPASRSVAVLLTNRVHPSREWGSNNDSRVALARGLAQSLAVRPTQGDNEWFSGVGPNRDVALSTDTMRTSGSVRLTFDAFVDTQADTDGTDKLVVESSSDDGRTWRPVPVTASGPGAADGRQHALAGAGHRSWWKVNAQPDVPRAAPVRLRWRYVSDADYAGRGVYVDGVTVSDSNGVVLDGETQPHRLSGWPSRSR